MTLKERRAQTGMTQAEVGEKLNVDQSAVSHWESGKWTPCRKYRNQLAKLYGCEADELLSSEPKNGNRKEKK